MEVKEEFGSAPGEEEAERAKQNLPFFCLFFFFFSCVRWEGRRRKGEPPPGLRENLGCWVTIDGRGTEKDMPGKPTAVVSGAAATALRAACSGIANTRLKQKMT